ncbi:hypothetical protein DEA8626_01437 [Defluviimonas aquaemixtae]|uniref:VWFA domain-containing protein n=2 Tax=Albidovulum aquaemixtae TaxID=1542388 RepID=A0A2R8B5K6_9RHOB|nr:hypothetical protein DEA8626_01437 [Defluviimonas aquaemixtae]
MFESLAGSPSTKLRIVYFGGGEVSDLGWEQSADIVARRMAEVSCRPGFTDILPSLARFLEKDEAGPASAIILIGDAYEEGPGDVEPLAQQLKSAGIKVFAFLEGEGTEAARAFSAFAEITDGKFARFGDELPLSDLCEGVALLTSGGSKGVKRIRNKNVRLLLSGPPNK